MVFTKFLLLKEEDLHFFSLIIEIQDIVLIVSKVVLQLISGLYMMEIMINLATDGIFVQLP